VTSGYEIRASSEQSVGFGWVERGDLSMVHEDQN
jgi:hypothetical protein